MTSCISPVYRVIELNITSSISNNIRSISQYTTKLVLSRQMDWKIKFHRWTMNTFSHAAIGDCPYHHINVPSHES